MSVDANPQALEPQDAVPAKAELSQWAIIRSHPSIIVGGILLGIMILIGVIGPLFTTDPVALINQGRIHYRGLPQQQSLEDWNDFWSEYKNA